MKWSENQIARSLVRTFLNNKCLMVIPRSGWTGYEADLLGVTPDGRLLDFEIKISRADLKADAKKDKWWQRTWQTADGRWERGRRARAWPVKIWKHYYVMPAEIWHEGLAESLGSPNSGVIVLSQRHGRLCVDVVRRARPAPEAYRLKPQEILDLARHVGLRLWDALARLEAGKQRIKVIV